MGKIFFTALALAAAMTLCIAFTGCGGSDVPERLVGEWDCAPLASDQMTDTGFYALTIEEDGTFSLYDKTAGTSGISGTMKGDDTGKLGILELTCDEDAFDPPVCWAKMQTKSRVRYKIMDENTIRLGYVGIWLIFTK
ncbi:MAG: hypothetical protein K6B42_08325 [Clostridia bacterium]|nr:hypothetical protein [Clostridia bacterium]